MFLCRNSHGSNDIFHRFSCFFGRETNQMSFFSRPNSREDLRNTFLPFIFENNFFFCCCKTENYFHTNECIPITFLRGWLSLIWSILILFICWKIFLPYLFCLCVFIINLFIFKVSWCLNNNLMYANIWLEFYASIKLVFLLNLI